MTTLVDNRQLTMPFDATLPPVWRPIHYLGSKLRLTHSIRALLSDIDPSHGTMCDLFAGSGTVALAMSADRSVVAADVQEYSRVLCTALLHPTALDGAMIAALVRDAEGGDLRGKLERCLVSILNYERHAIDMASAKPHLLCDLVEHGSLVSEYEERDPLGTALRDTRKRIVQEGVTSKLMATRYFGGIYFSYAQALFIDCVLDAIERLPNAFKVTCLAALLSATSSIVNTIGKHFAQPIRPRHKDGTIKHHIIDKMCRERRLNAAQEFGTWVSRYSALPKRPGHRVIRGDYRDVLSRVHDIAVVYADPPYTRDHYSRFYHVLETLSLRDFPDVTTTSVNGDGTMSRGLYRTNRHQSPFCIKSQAPQAFSALFAGCRRLGVPVLLSYSPYIKDGHPRLMTVEAIAKLASEYYRDVKIVPAGQIAHSKLNKSDLHLKAAEKPEVFLISRS